MVVYHDAVLPGLGRIAELELEEVRRHHLPNGERVPLLGEVLEIVGEREVWVEVKSLAPEHDEGLLALLAAGPAPTRYAVHGFDHRIVRRLRERAPALRTGVLLASYLLDTVAEMRAAGADTVWQEWQLIDLALLDAVHGAGGYVVAWTVDAPRDLARLARLGVDGLCGNYPDRLRVAASGNGRRAPPAPTEFPAWGR
jgi:glycerophosphoryl diester phosphodiesterase